MRNVMRKYNPIQLFAIVAVFAMIFGLAPTSVGAETIEVTDGMALECTYGPCDIKLNEQIGDGAFPWNQEDRSIQEEDSSASTSSADYGDFSCKGPACGLPLEGSSSYTNGTVLDPEWLASGQTGVGKKEVGWHVRVPEGYFLNIDAFEAHVTGTPVHGTSGVHASVGPGEYDVMMVDGALGVIAERSAKDNLCLRFTENAGRARDLVITPKVWGDNPCNVDEADYNNDYVQPGDPDADYTDGQLLTPEPSDDGTGDGSGTIDDGTGDDSGNGDDQTGTQCERQPSGDGVPLRFEAGCTVDGVDIVLDNGTKYLGQDGTGNCTLRNAPSGGTVTTGIISPNDDEIARTDKECGA